MNTRNLHHQFSIRKGARLGPLFPVLLCLLVTAFDLRGQSIFRDARDRRLIIPEIVPPEGPEALDEPLRGMENAAEEPGEAPAKLVDEEPIVATPVVPDAVAEEEALNRKRENNANTSSPGVTSLIKEAGQLRVLTPQLPETNSLEETNQKVAEIKEVNDPLDERLASTFNTREDARVFSFSIPAPRGQILDRKGFPLAQSKVVNYAAITFPEWGDEPDDTEVFRFVADRIAYVNELLGTRWDLPPDTCRDHYVNRRWMPLIFSGPLTKIESEKLMAKWVDGIKLIPIYLRHYPHEQVLSHVIGYAGQRPPRSTAPIANEEPFWGDGLGVQGLEKSYDKFLTGVPGVVSELWDGKGNKIREDTIAVPRPGNNVVTTIDLEMQLIAERLLRQRTHRGALVVMNCNNGDVVALASHPTFNPNDFIPSISEERYKALLKDPEKPLFPRAYQANYPPASTFKVPAALSFLEEGYISSRDLYPCPSRWSIGDLVMRNWNSESEGDMNVVSALARSCNTWFYEIGIHVGADAMSSMAFKLGLGEATGLPLSEDGGFIPNNQYWVKNYRSRLSDGDEANMSIGQGRVRCTPIQIARMMAAVGNQEQVFKARIVKQIQDVNHNVVSVFPSEVRNSLNLSSTSLKAVRSGLYNVVNASFGTGKSGNHKVTVSAKTGTGQWITSENRNIAWFVGYFPAQHPVYAFALVYEGNPNETVSGGKVAAPIMAEFLNEYLTDKNLAEVRRMSAEQRGDYIQTTWVDSPEMEEPEDTASIFRDAPAPSVAAPVDPVNQANPAASPERRESLFNRIFKRRR